MSAWTYTDAPVWFPTAIASAAGWRDPVTEELLVAIGQLEAKQDDADTAPTIVGVTVTNSALTTGDFLIAVVEFSEPVAVLGSPQIVVNFNAEVRQAVFDSAASTPTHVAFSYEVTAEDSAAAGEVTLGTVIDVSTGGVYDILPGGGLQPIDSILGIEPVSNLVAFN